MPARPAPLRPPMQATIAAPPAVAGGVWWSIRLHADPGPPVLARMVTGLSLTPKVGDAVKVEALGRQLLITGGLS